MLWEWGLIDPNVPDPEKYYTNKEGKDENGAVILT
jgi:hypothetical protein